MRRGKRTAAGTHGVLRVDARTSRLVPKLRPGDIAVLDHVDLDEATAQLLVRRGVAAVVNAAPSSSGRYPNLGPGVLVRAGVPLLDDVGARHLTALKDGRAARLDGDTLWVDDVEVARGMRQDAETVAVAADHARAGTAAQLADLAGTAPAFVLQEQALLLDGVGLPDLVRTVEGRHVLLVGPGAGAVEALSSLRRYRRRHRPTVVAVDGGADAVLAAGLRAHLVVGDPATMSDEALRSAGQVVLCGANEGRERVHDLAVPAEVVGTRAAPEDVALLLLARGGAAVVVHAGLPDSLTGLVDRGRAAAVSSLLARIALTVPLVHADTAVALTPRRSKVAVLTCVGLAAALAGSIVLSDGTVIDALVDAWHQLRP